jgi:hypothetical protein
MQKKGEGKNKRRVVVRRRKKKRRKIKRKMLKKLQLAISMSEQEGVRQQIAIALLKGYTIEL